jgi:hypothetical protein
MDGFMDGKMLQQQLRRLGKDRELQKVIHAACAYLPIERLEAIAKQLEAR